MANNKKLDFQKVMEENQTVNGFVKEAVIEKEPLESYLILKINKREVILYESELYLTPFKNLLESYVGMQLAVKIIAYDKENDRAIVSHKKAVAESLESLYSGKPQRGHIIHLVNHGAYIDVGGVPCLMRNRDFSNDGTSISDLYQKGFPIVVYYYKTSENGVIIVKPKRKIRTIPKAKVEDFEKGQTLIGKAISVFPDKVFVNISAGIDVLCEYPQTIYNLNEGELVEVKIIKVIPDKERIRGKILKSIVRQ